MIDGAALRFRPAEAEAHGHARDPHLRGHRPHRPHHLEPPRARNAITFAMPRELPACVERANLDPAVHVILSPGTARASAAATISSDFAASTARQPRAPGRRLAARPAVVHAQPRSLPALGSRGRLPDDEPQRARLHEPLPRREAGGVQGPRLLPRGRHGHGAVPDLSSSRTPPRSATRLRACGASPTTALWAFRLGPEKAKRLLFTGDSLTGTEAVAWGLATEAPARKDLDVRTEALFERIARVPVNQLVMSKLLVNQTLLAQGLPGAADSGDLLRRHRPPHPGRPRVRASNGRGRPPGGGPRARRAVRGPGPQAPPGLTDLFPARIVPPRH